MPVYMCAVSGGRRDSPAGAVGRGGPGGGGQGLLMGRGLPPGSMGQFTSVTDTKVQILANCYKYKH
jgi:hypothetical protein